MTLIEAFSDYRPVDWFDEAGSRIAGLVRDRSKTTIKRMRRWRNTAKGAALTVALSATFAAASVPTVGSASASNGLDVPVPPGMVEVAPPPDANSSLGDVNESFNQLFKVFRSGVPLIKNERTRQLA